MLPTIIRASSGQATVVSSVLTEAAQWLASRGEALWPLEHVSIEAITADVVAGTYHIAWLNGDAGGVVKFQLSDPVFWPESNEGDAVYLHRLAVRRCYAGGGVSTALLQWAANRALELNRIYVRLDCAADRPALRNLYERFGFKLHSVLEINSFTIARYQLEIIAAG
jgi:GNAT superfamily N-acetyltransferase